MNNDNKPFSLEQSVAIVTGASRGIGRAYVQRLAEAGARRIYAGARNIATLAELASQFSTVVPIQLDVTSARSVADAAARCNDVNLLINNAGVAHVGGVTGVDSLDDARLEMETNYFGLLGMTHVFAPILIENAPSAIVNVLSIASLMASPRLGTYGASKAAALSATRTMRAELDQKGVHVLAVMPGFVDTDMAAGFDVKKIAPSDVVDATFEALTAGDEDIFPGEAATQVASAFFSDNKTLEKQLANFK